MNLPIVTYDGLELDMLSIGDADSILVTRWVNGVPTRILIDGGNKSNASIVRLFLLRRRIRYVDHIVCTHPHDDHAAGLIEFVTDTRFDFGMFWMHLPWRHVNRQILDEALRRTSARRVANIINESLERSRNLANAVWRRKQYIYQPFAGNQIGFLTVCGPSEQLYGTLVSEFGDADRLAEFESNLAAHEHSILMENVRGSLGESAGDDGTLGAEPTEPENDSSVILATKFGSEVFVFTGDAGLLAFYDATKSYPGLGSCCWMQIPHHGSRRNISEDLIEFFRPRVAFVSASGTKKHPRRKVVNAFKDVGAVVFSTHYPVSSNLWYRVGFVPPRYDYGSAVSLYN
jgi:beta-lactamase superfamily II metal-dependent hydrolase